MCITCRGSSGIINLFEIWVLCGHCHWALLCKYRFSGFGPLVIVSLIDYQVTKNLDELLFERLSEQHYIVYLAEAYYKFT